MSQHQYAAMKQRVLKWTDVIALVTLLFSLFAFLNVRPASAAVFDSTAGGSWPFVTSLSNPRPSGATNLQAKFSTASNRSATNCNLGPCIALEVLFTATNTSAILDGIYIASSTNPVLTSDISVLGGSGSGLGSMTVSSTWMATTSNSFTQTNKLFIRFASSTANITLDAADQMQLFVLNNKIVTPAKWSAAGTADIYPVVVNLYVGSGASGGIQMTDTPTDWGSNNVAINDATTLSATVNTVLSMVVSAIASGANYDTAVTTDVTSTATTCPFGTLVPNVAKVCAQQVVIATNAPNGYEFYITQTSAQADGNMVAAAGSGYIAQFNSGTRLDDSAAIAWVSPNPSTVGGHLGYHSNDTTVFTAVDRWAGIPEAPSSAESPQIAGKVADKGTATTGDTVNVAFKVEGNALLPAGSYTGTVIYNLVAQY